VPDAAILCDAAACTPTGVVHVHDSPWVEIMRTAAGTTISYSLENWRQARPATWWERMAWEAEL
jgi:hypothetical protein